MPACKCHRCGEDITAIYWHEGKMYGYSCIRYVNPLAKKNKTKEHWVIADSHNIDMRRNEKQPFTAIYANKKYRDFVFKDHAGSLPQTIGDNVWRLQPNGILLINLAAFKA